MGATETDEFTRIERRIIQGREVRIRQHPDEIFVQWRPHRPVYIGVRVGDRIKDADRDVESARIDQWDVIEITPERVVGTHVRTGDERVWDREVLERGFVVGNYSTNLSDFALVTVLPVGTWDDYDEAATDDMVYRGPPYVTVATYGNNGEKYGRRYRFVEPGNATALELWTQDRRIERLPDEIRSTLDAVVRAALEDDGYALRE
ncbi:MAG: hypothetical protein ACQETI_07930 [Halobacteriota archaeon]